MQAWATVDIDDRNDDFTQSTVAAVEAVERVVVSGHKHRRL